MGLCLGSRAQDEGNKEIILHFSLVAEACAAKESFLLLKKSHQNEGEGRPRADVDIQTLGTALKAVLVSSLPLDLNAQINGRHSTEA